MQEFFELLCAENKPLPKGTRIRTKQGGAHTGGVHELSANVLNNANRVPNHLSDDVPFWVLGWRDLHDDLLPPSGPIVDGEQSS